MVFRAWQHKLHRHVAIKLMLPDRMDSMERVRRFRLKAEATARLDHPHIVPIYEIRRADGQHFLCMKLIQGETSAHFLAKKRFDQRGARTGSNRCYLSAAYDSMEDGLRKIGISVVMPAGETVWRIHLHPEGEGEGVAAPEYGDDHQKTGSPPG